MAETLEERIRRRAHEIWEQAGRPHGREDEHWESARAEIVGTGSPSLSASAQGMREGLQAPVSPGGGARGHAARARRKDATG